MFQKSLMAAVASAAIVAAAPVFGQGHGGGGGAGGPPPGAGAQGGMSSQGPANASPTGTMNASPNSVLSTAPPATTMTPPLVSAPPTGTTTDTNVSTKSKATTNSQGPANASPTGISHANSNSVLARGAVASTALPGLATGLVVNNSSGTQVGTVSKIITGPNNTIRAVVVTSSSGKTYTLPPSSLSISGSVVTTTSTSVGG